MLLVACYNQHGTIHDATLLKATVACYKVASRMVALTHQWIEEDTGTCQVFRFVRICCMLQSRIAYGGLNTSMDRGRYRNLPSVQVCTYLLQSYMYLPVGSLGGDRFE